MAAVSARMRCRTRIRTPAGVLPPCRSRSIWSLQVSKMDSAVWRSGLKNREPARSASPLRAGRSSVSPAPARPTSKLAPKEFLSPMRSWPARRAVSSGSGIEDARQYLALAGPGAGEREAGRQAVQSGEHMQAQAPEVPRVTGAVPVPGPSGQLRAAGGLPRPAALHRGGVHHPDVVGPQGGVAGQQADQAADRGGRPAQPLVIAGLRGEAPAPMAAMFAGPPAPNAPRRYIPAGPASPRG